MLTVFEGEVLASNAQGELPVPGGPVGRRPRRPGAAGLSGGAPARRRAMVALLPADLLRPAGRWARSWPRRSGWPPPATSPVRSRRSTGCRAGAGPSQTYRAALLLQVGRVEEASAALDAALAADPQVGAGARAALGHRRGPERARARPWPTPSKAVELAPTSAAAKIALSYAQQAHVRHRRRPRRRCCRPSTEQPERRAGLGAAVRAVADGRRSRPIARGRRPGGRRWRPTSTGSRPCAASPTWSSSVPPPARRRSSARSRSTRPIPLPRFGLGLAQIRDGSLEHGPRRPRAGGRARFQQRAAAHLSRPAYFEERREEPAGEQYQLAKELDPLDPTAYLYDAIRLQTINRPVEALEQLDKSIELNDNRAVYRSRLLLDSDRAARGASLARIYQDLDFLDTGVREATNSLTLDPTNPARTASCPTSMPARGGREVSRVSELLQSQLLQDLNLNPVQPALGETNLNIVTQGGPTTPGYNEFTPLFESNGCQVGGIGLLGNNYTKGGEGVASALYDRYSISAGAFGYDTDGWRENADIRHTIVNVFFQAAITPELNAQVEIRSRRSTHMATRAALGSGRLLAGTRP